MKDRGFENQPQETASAVSAEIVLYESEGASVPVEVRYLDETFWLTQKEMGELFGVDRTVVSKHLKNIVNSGELGADSICAKIAHMGSTGKMYETTIYNLDAIIAVGYRVNSFKATRFRQWATRTLKEYITKGFVLNDDMLKNGEPFGRDYFNELLARIRDIRASERRVWQKVTDIFQECSFDYDKDSEVAREFFASVQNKMHYAVIGQTAAEIVDMRADASKPHMGLTNWKGSPEGRIHSSDVDIAKNYLTEDEIRRLNRLVNRFLDDLEDRAEDHVLTSMQDCVDAMDGFLRYARRNVLQGKGTRSHAQAKRKALDEFSKFQKIQDVQYMNDFEKMARSFAEDGRRE